MTEKRFTIKPQDDLFGVVDNYSADKVCVINGIRTEIEAEWLCKDMNALNDENEQLKADNNRLVNETARIVAEHQNKVLNLIDRKINDYEIIKPLVRSLWKIEALKELKKELQE